uniref:BTB domain-containing protein n=1 Tax=Panagrolaimus sp. PS1159 TaxID=55785 RepID=A0AC35GDD2_9BILA
MSNQPRTYNGTVTSRIYQNGPASPKVNGYASIGRTSQHSASAAAQLKNLFNPFEHHGNDIVELNVGGCAFATTYHVLANSKSPYFKSIFKLNNFGRVVEIPDSITVN